MIDHLIYSTNSVDITQARLSIKSDGIHQTTVIRVDDDFQAPDDVDILASGWCSASDDTDCPFDKLSGDALAKFNLAYPRLPIVTPAHYDEFGDLIPEQTDTPPFKFGCFA